MSTVKCWSSGRDQNKLPLCWSFVLATAGTRTFSCESHERYAIWIDPSCRWMNGLMDRRSWFLPSGVEGWKIRYLEMGIAKSMACIWAAAKERTSVGIMVGLRASECSWSESDLRLSSSFCYVHTDRASVSFARPDWCQVLHRRSNSSTDKTVSSMNWYLSLSVPEWNASKLYSQRV